MPHHQPRIFLAYSKTKSYDEATTDAILEAFQAAFDNCHVVAVDPMKQPIVHGHIHVETETMESIRSSDAVFVIEYPPVPNTGYETGVANAWGTPSYHWLPESASGQIAHDAGHPTTSKLTHARTGVELPSDLGGRRYQTFPLDIASNRETAKAFREKVEGLIRWMREGPLSLHSIRARRAYREYAEKKHHLLMEHFSSPTMSWALESLSRQFHDYLVDGSRRFVVDESIYPTFLKTLGDIPLAAAQVYAVADLSNDIEQFWSRGSVHPVVGARIFRLSWATLFNDRELDRVLDFMKRQSSVYPLYVTDADKRSASHPTLQPGIDNNYFVFGDIVGFYIEDKATGANKLVVERDEYKSAALKREFDRIVTGSVKISPESTADEVRRAWIGVRQIGIWATTNQGGARRDRSYYEGYDKHIRTWIPHYEELARCVAEEVVSRLRVVNRPPESAYQGRGIVGEIGVGTGAVTKHVARWADRVESASVHARTRALGKYFCIDAAPQMVEFVRSELSAFNCHANFPVLHGRDFDELRSELHKTRCDVICGSLILHYLNGSQSGWSQLFDELDSLLEDDGVAVFGGCYFESKAKEKARQTDWWLDQMCQIGLDGGLAKRFLQSNGEMTRMPLPSELARQSAGRFVCRYQRVGPAPSPFGVAVFSRAVQSRPWVCEP